MERKQKKVIIAGCRMPEDWIFKKGIETGSGERWEVETCITDTFTGIGKYTRFIKYFLFPLKYVFLKNRYRKIISWDQFFGLVAAFYYKIFHIKRHPDIYVMTFIYKPKKGFFGKLYEKFIRMTIHSGHIKKIIVFGESEKKFYDKYFEIGIDLIKAEKLGVRDMSLFYEITTGNYYASAGRSNRDYDFIRKNWPGDRKIIIACDTEKRAKKENIVFIENCYEEKYLKLLAGAYAIIIPLEDRNISSGQLVAIHAAMFGKPVIATNNKVIEEYVSDGKTGYIIEKTENALKEALLSLDDKEKYKEMSANAKDKFRKEFDSFKLGERIGELSKSEQQQLGFIS